MVIPDATNRNRRRTPVLFFLIISLGTVGPLWFSIFYSDEFEMNYYNLIHFRRTDDQTFNVLLDSHAELAFPISVDTPNLAVYSVSELRDLTAYAKSKGIRIMPEINVPGHAGSWAGVPGLIVQCPEFICEKGHGIPPSNVTHPALRPILTDILKELVDIFDDPPFLHLVGGDEVDMAGPCSFREVGAQIFDYPVFERVLKQIIADVGYPEGHVVRWEMTGQAKLERAGKIE
jgi:N-acetyl-beta-hexosaminidase